jgi:hypothetical protein
MLAQRAASPSGMGVVRHAFLTLTKSCTAYIHTSSSYEMQLKGPHMRASTVIYGQSMVDTWYQTAKEVGTCKPLLPGTVGRAGA